MTVRQVLGEVAEVPLADAGGGVASFLEQLDKPNDAVAFLGNALSYSFSGGQQSVGLCFASDCLQKTASASVTAGLR